MLPRRTWEYETQLDVRVILVSASGMLCEHEESREGFILLGGVYGAFREGDEITIEFVRGGPTGGHWARRAKGRSA